MGDIKKNWREKIGTIKLVLQKNIKQTNRKAHVYHKTRKKDACVRCKALRKH